jgi:hypothetical protein
MRWCAECAPYLWRAPPPPGTNTEPRARRVRRAAGRRCECPPPADERWHGSVRRGRGTAEGGAAGGGPSTEAAAARQGSSRPRAPTPCTQPAAKNTANRCRIPY